MAGPTLFQIRRTSVADREANTVTLPTVGEMGVNLTDGRMWVANSSNVFEIGANTRNCRIANTLYIGNSTVNVTANSTQINASVLQALTGAYVGDNVDITTAGLFIGNTSVNVIANSTIVKLANSTVNTSISVPTSAAYSATNYFLHANGTWVQVTTTGGGGSVPVYQTYTATGGQTTFTVSGGYTVGQVEVYVNGVKLAKDEYTENGTTVVLDVGALINSIVEVSGWIALFSYSPTAGGSATQVQYNDSGPFGGSAGFIFDKNTNNATLANTLTVGSATVNSTKYSQTANNADFLGGVAAAGYVLDADLDAYQTEAGLAANVATLDANNSAYLGGVAAADYQTEAGLSANVATLTSNNTLYLGGTLAADYQTEAGLAANVATLTSNNTLYLGGTLAADYQTEAGLAANVATLSANNTTYVGGNVFSNSTGIYPLSNTSGDEFGNTIARWVITANSSTLSGGLTSGLSVSVGANNIINTTAVLVGNSTTNVIVSNNKIDIGNSVANVVANSITITVANSTGFSQINPSYMYNGNGATQALQSGGVGFWYGNNTTNVTSGTVTSTTPYLQVANSTSTANLTPAILTIGTWHVANSLGIYHTGTINAASFTVGTSTIVNSTMVSVTAGSLLSANVQINPQTGTTYTLAATDSGKIVTMNNAGAMTVTLPAGLPIGFRCQVLRLGAGTCTLSNTGQTSCNMVSRTGAFAISAQYGSASVFQTATANTYIVDGNI